MIIRKREQPLPRSVHGDSQRQAQIARLKQLAPVELGFRIRGDHQPRAAGERGKNLPQLFVARLGFVADQQADGQPAGKQCFCIQQFVEKMFRRFFSGRKKGENRRTAVQRLRKRRDGAVFYRAIGRQGNVQQLLSRHIRSEVQVKNRFFSLCCVDREDAPVDCAVDLPLACDRAVFPGGHRERQRVCERYVSQTKRFKDAVLQRADGKMHAVFQRLRRAIAQRQARGGLRLQFDGAIAPAVPELLCAADRVQTRGDAVRPADGDEQRVAGAAAAETGFPGCAQVGAERRWFRFAQLHACRHRAPYVRRAAERAEVPAEPAAHGKQRLVRYARTEHAFRPDRLRIARLRGQRRFERIAQRFGGDVGQIFLAQRGEQRGFVLGGKARVLQKAADFSGVQPRGAQKGVGLRLLPSVPRFPQRPACSHAPAMRSERLLREQARLNARLLRRLLVKGALRRIERNCLRKIERAARLARRIDGAAEIAASIVRVQMNRAQPQIQPDAPVLAGFFLINGEKFRHVRQLEAHRDSGPGAAAFQHRCGEKPRLRIHGRAVDELRFARARCTVCARADQHRL